VAEISVLERSAIIVAQGGSYWVSVSSSVWSHNPSRPTCFENWGQIWNFWAPCTIRERGRRIMWV